MARTKSVGVWIRRNRQANEWTQLALAKRLGYQTSAMVCNWEREANRPGVDAMRKLEQLFGQFNAKKAEEEMPEAAEGSEFGIWLRSTIQEKGMTLAQLSERAGVSMATISLIQTGKINNPQQRTREKLIKGLGARIDDAPEEVQEENFIKGLGVFQRFNPHDAADWPRVNGVYVLYDVTDRPTYIGRGKPIHGRIRDHSSRQWFIKPFVDKAAFIPVDDRDLRKSLESILIKFMQSNAMVNDKDTERDIE